MPDRGAPPDALPPVTGAEKRRYVFDMFSELAPDYDRWNRILSLGLDRWWRYRALKLLVPCRRVCDLGTGTGDMARALFRHADFRGTVVALDPSPRLWKAGREDLRKDPRCRFAVAEGEHLPLRDGACDGIMSGFVMRNFFDFDLAIRESARIVRRGGRAVFLEMGHPASALWGGLFRFYFQRLAPAIASRLARNGRAYRYLPASLARFPSQAEVCARFLENGWRSAEYKEYLGGAVVAYRAER